MKFQEVTYSQYANEVSRVRAVITEGDTIDLAVRKKWLNATAWDCSAIYSTAGYRGYGSAGKSRLITVYADGVIVTNITGKGDKTTKYYKINP